MNCGVTPAPVVILSPQLGNNELETDLHLRPLAGCDEEEFN